MDEQLSRLSVNIESLGKPKVGSWCSRCLLPSLTWSPVATTAFGRTCVGHVGHCTNCDDGGE